VVARSCIEAGYHAMADTTCKLLWLKGLLVRQVLWNLLVITNQLYTFPQIRPSQKDKIYRGWSSFFHYREDPLWHHQD